MDPSALPASQHTFRRMPAAFRSEDKTELGDLEMNGIIKKETSLTAWILHMSVVDKPGKINIRLDRPTGAKQSHSGPKS